MPSGKHCNGNSSVLAREARKRVASASHHDFSLRAHSSTLLPTPGNFSFPEVACNGFIPDKVRQTSTLEDKNDDKLSVASESLPLSDENAMVY